MSDPSEAPWVVLGASPEATVDLARSEAAHALGAEPEVLDGPEELLARAGALAEKGRRLLLALDDRVPQASEWVTLAARCHDAGLPCVVAIPGRAEEAALQRGLLGDLGVVAVASAEAALSAATLLSSGLEAPWQASLRALPAVDRAWFAPTGSGRRGAPALRRGEAGRLRLEVTGRDAIELGAAPHVAEALAALRAAHGASWPRMPVVEGVDEEAVREVLFGPRRALSDPTSKAALAPYGLPVPEERLCRSASRTATEAARIGFPVRIALASPELRTWEHPDLVADGVDNAARAKDVFRQVTALARLHAPEATVLGVTVSATAEARCYLRMRIRAAPRRRALARIGFADPHGLACGDEVLTVLPQPLRRLEAVLRRLAGHPLLLPPGERRAVLQHLGDALLRLAAFADRWREEVEWIHVEPLAVLPGGEVELREAAIQVGDAFERRVYGEAAAG